MKCIALTMVVLLMPVVSVFAADKPAENVLLQSWTGPYGTVPPFDKVKVADFKPALTAAMEENLKEIDAITANKAPADFKNTIEAMERSGDTLTRIGSIYGIWATTMNTPEFQAVQTEMDPKLAAFNDKITQNAELFKKVEAVYNSPEKDKLTPEQQRLVWVYYVGFVSNGAKLDEAGKKRVAEINQRLASLYNSFRNNLLADEGDVLFLKEADLEGLPQPLKDAAAATAEEKGRKGEFAILNTRSSVEPFLTNSSRRDLREKVWKTFINRGDNGDEHDNNKIITEILQLRSEKTKLLGYTTYAHWRLENTMAKTPDRAMDLMVKVWPAAVARVREDVAAMQAIADKEGAGFKIAPWDYRYYAEKVRKAKYDLDMNDVKPYLQLDKMREAMFWMAGKLYGYHFSEIKDVPTAHPDIRVWQVKDNDGKHVGLWYFDPYARSTKRSGAWMNSYRAQQKLVSLPTIVSNNTNFVKGKPGEPVLISWIDAETLFHEFGHALHGLSSNVTYPSVAGTSVSRDYVEFPSQVHENWLITPEILSKYAIHYQTGKPIPQDLVDRILKAQNFNEGFTVTEYLSSALVDMKMHTSPAASIDPDAFERDTLKEIGMPEEIVMRHRVPQFSHLFSSDSYAAGYYSYLWSEVLAADAYNAFLEASGPYDPTVAKKLKEQIMGVGNTVDPAQAFRNFRGRDPVIDAYLKSKGFPAK